MSLSPIPFPCEIPLFPLPNCVVFPGVIQPLHIFEPRYRAMMQAALEVARENGGGTRPVLAMALLKPGWESAYYGNPDIHECVCAGRVIAHELLADGNYNLLLQGVSRARMTAERTSAGEWGQFRMVRLEAVPDHEPSPELQALQRQVYQRLFTSTALKDLTVTPALAPLFEDSVPIGRLIDALAFALVKDVRVKQRLLEESEVGARGELLLRELMALEKRVAKQPCHAPHPWPPEMGMN
jgi:uncharacterized protein